MTYEKLNEFMRDIFRQLIDDGFTKRRICSLTLGNQSEPQFEQFLQGKNVGIKPITRLFNAFNLEAQIVLIPKDDEKMKNYIEEHNLNTIRKCQEILLNYLNEDLSRPRIRQPRGSVIDRVIEDLIQ